MRTLTVGAVMTKDVAVVSPGTEFKDIAELLARRRISAVAVVDGETLVGVVSEADLLPKEQYAGEPAHHSRFGIHRDGRQRRKAAAVLARDLMTAPARTVGVAESLSAVARQLTGTGLRRLFVVDGDKLVGVIARRDLVGVFLRADAEIKSEIERDVFGKALLADPACYSVTVRNGEVMLLGRVERRSLVTAAGELAALVPGVVGVCNRLGYVWDDKRE
ncbi:CBS domain-containing protein [Amycolatopsis acididurans]|nr:CBS domain-containing protein [Amycolatopsis acididurans]